MLIVFFNLAQDAHHECLRRSVVVAEDMIEACDGVRRDRFALFGERWRGRREKLVFQAFAAGCGRGRCRGILLDLVGAGVVRGVCSVGTGLASAGTFFVRGRRCQGFDGVDGRVVGGCDEAFLVLRGFLRGMSDRTVRCRPTYGNVVCHGARLVQRLILELDRTLDDGSQRDDLSLELADPVEHSLHHRVEPRRGRGLDPRLKLPRTFHLGVPFLRDFRDLSAQDDDEFFEFYAGAAGKRG